MTTNTAIMSDPARQESFKPRGYQLEMLEESLKRNTIVAMDTGSGKTHIAVLRIMTEMEQLNGNQIIWFLAPTVALCEQQNAVLQLNIPAIRTRLLIGSDNVDRWSDQRTWDAALKDIHCVVSTHAVLADALSHGFVSIAKLSLLIMDEAHHCTRNHPANRIMQHHYHPAKLKGGNIIPRILGLTASTIIRSNLNDLRRNEQNMDCIARTPRLHRQELMTYVHRPRICRLSYTILDTGLNSLIIRLTQLMDNSPSIPELWNNRLRKFGETAMHIMRELGEWPAALFIAETLSTVKRKEEALTWNWEAGEANYYQRILEQLPSNPRSQPLAVSNKVVELISLLEREHHDGCAGIVFVRRRAVVAMLSKLLSLHPQTKDLFRTASFVGLSNNVKRKVGLAEVLDLKAQSSTLPAFRKGDKNLIIATDALEEGIDIATCGVVICFDPPSNVKSFIQRRGRARQVKSLFVIMMEETEASSIGKWLTLEQEMMKLYQNDQRMLQDAAELEDILEKIEHKLVVPSTGALLTADFAIAHLHHFCAKLPPQPYVDFRPIFRFKEKDGLIEAIVTLPAGVNASFRQARSCRLWKTEKAAAKDAAFHAYKHLFEAGLVNSHLLPLHHEDLTIDIEEVPSQVEIEHQFDPWISADSITYRTDVVLSDDTTKVPSLMLVTHAPIPQVDPFVFYLSRDKTLVVSLTTSQAAEEGDNRLMADITQLLLRSVQSDRESDQRTDYVALAIPVVEGLQKWFTKNNGRRPALEYRNLEIDLGELGFVRDASFNGYPHIFANWHDELDQDLGIECTPLPLRRNFLFPITSPDQKEISIDDASVDEGRKRRILIANQCTIDALSAQEAQKALIIPAVMQHLSAWRTAEQMLRVVMLGVPTHNVSHFVTAIMSPSTQWITDYQRYEFLGDTLLKFSISTFLYLIYPDWHEGYLTRYRAKLVSNSNLTKVALRVGLAPFIITTPFLPRKWKMPLLSDIKSSRCLSSKVLSDVVEAIIAAAFLDGGSKVMQECIKIFFPEYTTNLPSFNPVSINSWLMGEAVRVVGHEFQHANLLKEALTHPSMERDSTTESYQRLEFLGDAVLDMVVVLALWETCNTLSPYQMTLIKAALVNSNFLGFLCMEFSIEQARISIMEVEGEFVEEHGKQNLQLWRFMRHHSEQISAAQQSCLERYEQLHDEIRACLDYGQQYPWALLAQLHTEKFFSDLVESVMGAIFIDVEGEPKECTKFAERLGIMSYLRRIVADDIDVEQPRTRLQHVAGCIEVQYDVKKVADIYECCLRVGEVAVTVSDCLSRDESMIRAADEAIPLVERLKLRKRKHQEDLNTRDERYGAVGFGVQSSS